MPKYLWYFIKNQGRYILFFVLVAIIYNLILIISSYFLSKTIGHLPYLLKNGDFGRYIFYLEIFLLAEILNILVSIIHTVVYTRFRGYMNIFVRIFGVDKMIELDYSKLAKLGSGKLLQIVKNGIEAYTFLIFNGIDRLIEFFIRFIFLFFILSYFDYKFAFVFLFGFFLTILVQKYIYKKLTQVREKERQLNEDYTKQTAKIFMNFILLKIANLKQKELNKLYKIGKERVDNYVWLKFWFSAGARFINLLITGIFIFSLFYFGKLFLQGKVSFDLIIWISILFMFARRVLNRLAFFISELAEKWTYIERFDNLIESKVTNDNSSLTFKKDNIDGDIFSKFSSVKFENIWFKYEGQKLYLFEGFNFIFNRGEKIAILGRSGSGKSTLFKMLVRLIEPEKGNIKIILNKSSDNLLNQSSDQSLLNKSSDKSLFKNLKEINPLIIYQKIGYFYQEPLVFDGTIRENLTLGLTNVSDEKLKQILKIIELDHLSLDTIIGERGVLLSGGERQRLALGRTFVFDYEILLLDEPTSNLDLYLEKKILEEIFKRYKDKTVLVVSHRPYVLKNVDRIVVMKKGEIILDGKKNDKIINQIEQFIS